MPEVNLFLFSGTNHQVHASALHIGHRVALVDQLDFLQRHTRLDVLQLRPLGRSLLRRLARLADGHELWSPQEETVAQRAFDLLAASVPAHKGDVRVADELVDAVERADPGHLARGGLVAARDLQLEYVLVDQLLGHFVVVLHHQSHDFLELMNPRLALYVDHFRQIAPQTVRQVRQRIFLQPEVLAESAQTVDRNVEAGARVGHHLLSDDRVSLDFADLDFLAGEHRKETLLFGGAEPVVVVRVAFGNVHRLVHEVLAWSGYPRATAEECSSPSNGSE